MNLQTGEDRWIDEKLWIDESECVSLELLTIYCFGKPD